MTISTLGIIGSGQLGSLLCQAAEKLNIKTIVISDDKNGPAQKLFGWIYLLTIRQQRKDKGVYKQSWYHYLWVWKYPINILNEINKEKKST